MYVCNADVRVVASTYNSNVDLFVWMEVLKVPSFKSDTLKSLSTKRETLHSENTV